MSLEKLLTEKRSSIINTWRNLIIGSYPSDTQRFLKREKNRFANPVGQTIAEDLQILYDELVTGKEIDKISSCLENIIRIRAVQNFKPSQAVGFVLQLKKIIRDNLKAVDRLDELLEETETVEERIDSAALLAFDVYTKCRDKIYELRVTETKRQVGRLLERANLTIEIPEYKPDL